MRRAALAFAAFAALAPASARANDSTAVFAAGGLVLTETDAIALVSEDLVVARDGVRVRYVFENRTASDVETLVAFPLPDIDLATYSEVPVDQPHEDADNFVGFTVTVDGASVEPDLHVKATLDGRDVTGVLAEAGVPVSLFAGDLYTRLWDIPRETQDALQAEGLAFYDRDYDGVYPQWTQHVAFTWTQTFPADQTVVVEHAYRPVVGTRFVSRFSLTNADEAAFRARYCLDERRGEIEARLDEAGDEYAMVLAHEIGYVLTTGSNWAGPIGALTLTIDAGEGNLALTCFEGLSPDGPSRLSGRFTDMRPEQDLWVLIIRRDPEG